MTERVGYALDGDVATITLDDGKANALSPAMQSDVHAALDQAETDGARVIVITGRPGFFSAGFDLRVIAAGGAASADMVMGGFALSRRLLATPVPVVMVATGHVIAMGSFLMLSGDYRIGTTAPARITANEVAIGMTMPKSAIEIIRQRLTPAAFNRAILLAEMFTPSNAVAAGWFDEVVEPDALADRVAALTQQLLQLDSRAHAASKHRARAAALGALDQAMAADRAEFDRPAERERTADAG